MKPFLQLLKNSKENVQTFKKHLEQKINSNKKKIIPTTKYTHIRTRIVSLREKMLLPRRHAKTFNDIKCVGKLNTWEV